MRWAVLATLVVLVVVGCVPLILEERHEFVVEVAGKEYLDEVMSWYQPSYSDYISQKKPVIVLYYNNETPFVAAAGEEFSSGNSGNLTTFLNEKWRSYDPIFDVDVFVTDGKYCVRLREKKGVLQARIELIKFKKVNNEDYYEVCAVVSQEDLEEKNDLYILGDPSDLRTTEKGFAFVVRDLSKTVVMGREIYGIVGAEVVWPVSQ